MLAAAPAARAAPAPMPADPLGSPMWEFHARRILAGAPVVFDPMVRVMVPGLAENQHAFPLTVDARTLPGVTRIVVWADLNPITQAIEYRPTHAQPFISLRIKLDQRTPVRAAVLAGDGKWHVAGVWVDAAGGGCSAPPVSRVKGDWADHLGEMRGQAWREGNDVRMRVTIRHPMDTGLVENIPPYNLEELVVRSSAGAELARMSINGSVAEDPTFSLLLHDASGAPLRVWARDSNGRQFSGQIGLQSRMGGAK